MNELKVTINLDMDGTIARLYEVENWLDYLVNEDTFPYEVAKAQVHLSTLARRLNTLQRNGYDLAIVSWLSKSGSEAYNEAVTAAKLRWLKKHLPSVSWDEIHIVPYGTPKSDFCKTALDILFDDEEKNLRDWCGFAIPADEMMETLRELVEMVEILR